MKSVDRLRDYGHDCCARIDDAIHDYCDEIEAEIAERYLAIPLDADGVPIRVGDKLIAYNERVDVEGVGDGIVIYRTENDELCLMFNPAAAVHVKPRTLEDVLEEFADMPERIDRIAATKRYAEEIRELLLGGDA